MVIWQAAARSRQYALRPRTSAPTLRNVYPMSSNSCRQAGLPTVPANLPCSMAAFAIRLRFDLLVSLHGEHPNLWKLRRRFFLFQIRHLHFKGCNLVFVFLALIERPGKAGIGFVQLGLERFLAAQFAQGRRPKEQHRHQQRGQNAGDDPAGLGIIRASTAFGHGSGKWIVCAHLQQANLIRPRETDQAENF